MFGTILGIISILCTIWVLYEVWAKNGSLSTEKKVLWTVFGIFFGIPTAIVYYFIGR